MKLVFNRYRLELFKKTMSEDDYKFLYSQRIVVEGHLMIERRNDKVFLLAEVKRTKFESISSDVGQPLSDNLRSMYDDLIIKLKNRGWQQPLFLLY